jgi:hypothetical protein
MHQQYVSIIEWWTIQTDEDGKRFCSKSELPRNGLCSRSEFVLNDAPDMIEMSFRLTCFCKLNISQFLLRAVPWKYTHLHNSAQVIALPSYITVATLFLR